MCHVSSAVKVISFDHLELEERNEKSDETLGGGYLYLGEISSPLMPTALRCWEISGLKGCRTSSFGLLLGLQFRGPFFLIVELCADKERGWRMEQKITYRSKWKVTGEIDIPPLQTSSQNCAPSLTGDALVKEKTSEKCDMWLTQPMANL